MVWTQKRLDTHSLTCAGTCPLQHLITLHIVKLDSKAQRSALYITFENEFVSYEDDVVVDLHAKITAIT